MKIIISFILLMFISFSSYSEVDLRAPPPNQPAMEHIPQSSGILAPLKNLVSNYEGFSLPSHASSCYAPAFQYLNRTYILNTHCTVLEVHRSTIGLIAVLMWAILGFSIIMSA